MIEVEILVEDDSDLRLDSFVAENVDEISRSMAGKLISDGLISVDGVLQKASYKLKCGEVVFVSSAQNSEIELVPQEIPLDIIFEDEDLIVINKQPGLPVHPGPGHPDQTLANGVLYECQDLKGIRNIRPGIVHRLDKDTSGVIVVAKNDKALSHLSNQLKNREVQKTYLCLVKGNLPSFKAMIDAPIARDPYHRQRMAVVENGRESSTKFNVLKRFENFDYVEVKPLTGRTHQIRVHMNSLGNPVAGDSLYNGSVPNLNRQFLHAQKISFVHPSSFKFVEFTAGLAEDLTFFLNHIDKE